MKTRLLCFLTALLLLLPALACADCTHHDDDGRPYGLVPKGYVAPQPGVPGYTGDQCCAVCGAVVIHGSEIPPLPEPDNREEKQKQEEEIAPAAVPEAPIISVEQPPAAQPEPEAPVVPAAQQPEASVVPAAQTQEQAQPETRPTENKEQAPVQTVENKQETQPESKPADLPAPPPEEKKTEEKKPEQKQTNKPKNPDKKTSGGGGKTKKTERERFSLRFPYRRVRMTPAPDFDYWVEFPGELLWPLPESPFLDMFD